MQDKYATRLDVPRDEWNALVQRNRAARADEAEDGELVKQLGGLHVIGTERHEARRIDLQLRGRCGRQGDPGSSRFFLSLEDDLMRIFAGEWVKNILERLGMKEGEAIESRMVTRRIEAAQKKVEERNFEIRKNLLEYDEVMDEQRKRVYGYRQRILEGASCRDADLDMIRGQIDRYVDMFLDRDYGVDTFAKWAGTQLSTTLDPRDFRGMDFAAAEMLRQGPGGTDGRNPGPRRHRREPARGRGSERVELGSAGQGGQHALAPEPARSRPQEGRPRQRRRAADREGPRSDPRIESDRRCAVPAG